jgi:hypothetical protein
MTGLDVPNRVFLLGLVGRSSQEDAQSIHAALLVWCHLYHLFSLFNTQFLDIKGKSHLMESLKEAHHTPLYDAFNQIADVVTYKIDKTGEEYREVLLSMERFMSWEQVEAVIEGGLAVTIIKKEFTKQCHNTDDGKQVVNFESFCTLLARLEHMDINNSPSKAPLCCKVEAPSPDDGTVRNESDPEHTPQQDNTPDDVENTFNNLLKSTRQSSSLRSSSGVSLRAVLHWPQLQEAVKKGLVSERFVADLFFSSLQNQSIDDTSTSCVTMSKPEFIQFSLNLQRHIDKVCEEQEAMLQASSGYGVLFHSLSSIVSTLEKLSNYVSTDRVTSQRGDHSGAMQNVPSHCESRLGRGVKRVARTTRSLSLRKKLRNPSTEGGVSSCRSIVEDEQEEGAEEEEETSCTTSDRDDKESPAESRVALAKGGIVSFTKQMESVSSSVHDLFNTEIAKYITSRLYFTDSSL